jgi:hypothetical protein
VRLLAAAGLVLLGLLPEPDAPLEFRIQYLTMRGRRQSTNVYDFNGDGRADILNVSIDFDQDPPQRWLAYHFSKEGTFANAPDSLVRVDDRAVVLVFGDYLPGGGVETGFLAEDGLYVYPPGGKRAVKLLHVPTFLRSGSPRQLHVWWWAIDVDGNETHDVIVPAADGYRLYFQTAPGVFGRTARLEADLCGGAPRALDVRARVALADFLAGHFSVVRELPRIQAVDINGDGMKDFITVCGDTITTFLQEKPGLFPSRRPFRFAFAVPTLKEEIRKDTVDLALMKFTDLNQDRIADLVVTRIEGTLGLWESIKTSVYLHLGTGRGNFVPDQRIAIDGVSIDPEFIDMDGDGALDAVTSRLRTDLMKQAVDAFVLGDIAISYEVFHFSRERNAFLADPVYEKRILVRKEDLEETGAGAVPLVFIRGDLSGDGRPDLVTVDPKALELRIHPGRARGGSAIGFDGTAHWRVKVARHPKGMDVLDLNGDGISDVLLHHAGTLGLVLSGRK